MDPAKGPLVLIGGRPGNKVWVNPDGLGGDTWIEQLLPPAAQRWGSTCYNGIVALNSTAGIAAYDESGSRRTVTSPRIGLLCLRETPSGGPGWAAAAGWSFLLAWLDRAETPC